MPILQNTTTQRTADSSEAVLIRSGKLLIGLLFIRLCGIEVMEDADRIVVYPVRFLA
jgi:hypothetical protein